MVEIDLDLVKRVKDIPGKEGFWKSDTEGTFLRIAKDLIAHGYNKEEALEILTDLWQVSSSEYGN